MAKISHKSLFDKMRNDTVIDKACKHAFWTLPYLMADYTEMKSESLVLERDYQSAGSLLVNHLSSKLARIMFPSQYPFFKIAASASLRALASEKGLTEEQFNQSIARQEVDSCKLLFRNASYNQLVLMLKHLITSGNALVYRDTAQHRTVTYGLQSFVVRRNGDGTMVDCVLREPTYVEALPPAIQDFLKTKDKARFSRPETQVDLYTRIQRVLTRHGSWVYEVTQEVDTIPVGDAIRYQEHLCPWRAVAWNLIAGEHYGRSLVEDYAGDFARISSLSEAQTLYACEMMRVVHLVKSGGGADPDDLNKAECGEFIEGDLNNVGAYEAGDSAKIQVTQAAIDGVFARLSRAFMYNVNTRDAERVTMYELKLQAEEAENALGGHYSVLSESIQVPMAHLLLMENTPEMAEGFITEEIKVDIEAGIPALGRASDVQNLMMAVQEIQAIVPVVMQADRRIDPRKVVDMILAGRSVDPSQIFKSKEQLKQEDEAQRQTQQGMQAMQAAASAADSMNSAVQLNSMLAQG